MQIGYRLALLLATSRDPAIRNGAQALQMAERMVAVFDQSGRRSPHMLQVLAAALAENGRYEEAVTVADEALALAREQQVEDLLPDLEMQRERYINQEPWRGR
jgi:hypothetical protein